VVVVVVCIYSI